MTQTQNRTAEIGAARSRLWKIENLNNGNGRPDVGGYADVRTVRVVGLLAMARQYLTRAWRAESHPDAAEHWTITQPLAWLAHSQEDDRQACVALYRALADLAPAETGGHWMTAPWRVEQWADQRKRSLEEVLDLYDRAIAHVAATALVSPPAETGDAHRGH